MESWIAIPVIKSIASQSISTRGHGKRVGKNLPNPIGMEKPGPSYCILFLEMKSPKRTKSSDQLRDHLKKAGSP